jgi:hypothetical protein
LPDEQEDSFSSGNNLQQDETILLHAKYSIIESTTLYGYGMTSLQPKVTTKSFSLQA